jgi:hypothetical protein
MQDGKQDDVQGESTACQKRRAYEPDRLLLPSFKKVKLSTSNIQQARDSRMTISYGGVYSSKFLVPGFMQVYRLNLKILYCVTQTRINER